MIQYPKIFRLRQKFSRPRVEDIPATVEQELLRLSLAQCVRPGQSVAITAGSRGIANIHLIIKAIVGHFRSIGAQPFIVPAMGSHGGGTAEGQRKLIESYGITEEFCGCPIRSSMETVVVCEAEEGFPVHIDRLAYEADHVLVCGRVKPHTAFTGSIESGLMKMMLIGLGKHAGAKVYHAAIQDYSFDQIVRSVGRHVLKRCNVVAGLAIVENAYDETARLQAVAPEEFEPREQELLQLAKEWMPRLPFDRVDVLLIDEMGKNISGSGMDTNVIGRKYYENVAAPDEFPKVKRIVTRGLTRETHGNAIGIGIVDFCTQRLAESIDRHSTWINGWTASHIGVVKMPPAFETDRAILDAALPTIGLTPPERAKVLWIRNTLDLAEVECSAVFLDDAQQRDDLEVLSPLRDLPLDAQGNLPLSQAELR
ncbi:MAG: lactate racemase domain-containing protein [Pirellulales bacterium]